MNKIRFIAHAAKRLLDNKALYAQLLVTRGCNLSCAYCNEYTPGAPHVPLPELMQRIDKLDALGVLVYDILGGEPLMHSDLAALIAHIKVKRNGNNLLTLISNGFLLTKDIIHALNNAGLDMLQLSVDSVSPGAQSMKSLKSLLPKLHLLKQHARFTVKVQTVLTGETADEYDKFREILADFPFAFSFSFLHRAGGQIAISGQEYVDLFDRHQLWGGMRLYRQDARALLQGDFSRPWKCLGGSKFLYVNVNGHIQWCSQQKGDDIPLAQASTADLYAAHKHKPCEKGCALGCARLISHALGQPLKTLSTSLSVLKIIPDR
ncbi:MAG: radical SAM protein [Mariprofundaceae bacterium]|nr:radical SAM protein [Mariprofundaceae bacterium]